MAAKRIVFRRPTLGDLLHHIARVNPTFIKRIEYAAKAELKRIHQQKKAS